MTTTKKTNDSTTGNQPSLTSDSTFRFRCHPGVPCFTECCRDITIFLTPHDVLRLKRNRGLLSWDFITSFTNVLYREGNPFPLVQLKMSDNSGKPCHFVASPAGCEVYEDRPWACRMYPLDQIGEGTYQPIVGDEKCKGFGEDREWLVSEWLQNQGVATFDEYDYRYSMLTQNPQLRENIVDNEQIRDMIFMALYDLDRFRRFVFESRFLNMFDLPDEEIELLKTDDRELLKLGFRWLGFGLINPLTIRIKPAVIDEFLKDHPIGETKPPEVK